MKFNIAAIAGALVIGWFVPPFLAQAHKNLAENPPQIEIVDY